MNKQVVAPLNLSTTVEGSLVGLRESLVTLSAALESQGRRLELALTTEGLRFSEEVGSLKAIVQGLRMQVSSQYLFGVTSPFLRGLGFVIRVALYPFTSVLWVLVVGLSYKPKRGHPRHFVIQMICIGFAVWRERDSPCCLPTSYLCSP